MKPGQFKRRKGNKKGTTRQIERNTVTKVKDENNYKDRNNQVYQTKVKDENNYIKTEIIKCTKLKIKMKIII